MFGLEPRSTILKGSKIPDNVVVAGSVVSGNVGKENTIYHGKLIDKEECKMDQRKSLIS